MNPEREDAVLAERVWANIDRHGPDECWPWTGPAVPSGYGVLSVNGRNRRATHLVLELTTGEPFPPGMLACHHCDNPPCCNPSHLFVGTQSDNMRDAIAKGRFDHDWRGRQTHCKRGHEFTPENTYLIPKGGRSCRTCVRELNRGYEAAKRAARAEA